jgi:hypothetical protein
LSVLPLPFLHLPPARWCACFSSCHCGRT